MPTSPYCQLARPLGSDISLRADRARATNSSLVPYRVFFSFDPTLGVRAILEKYSCRWGIEVFSRDAKRLLGFADSRARKEEAVLRAARRALNGVDVLVPLKDIKNLQKPSPPSRVPKNRPLDTAA